MRTRAMIYHPFTRRVVQAAVLALCLVPLLLRAEYHGFNTGYNSDGIVQEVRWPYWAESTYNAIYSQTLRGSDGASCYFYGGMPSDPNGNPPCSIIWSFWPPGGSAEGKAVTAAWTGPTMFAPPHIGEGASGKASGAWPLITTNRWYREVLRVWQPVDAAPQVGYAARWLRDPDTGIWYHLATMKTPFSATGIDGLGGFQEDFSHGNRNPRRTDYRNVYYRQGGPWQMANQFTASVRQATEKGTAQLIEGDTAAFFEVSMDPAYSGNLDNDAGQKSITLTMVNQPATPSIDPIVVSSSGASVSGNQLLVHWQVPPTSSPQFAYQIEVFDNSGYTGAPSLTVFDIAPETRQHVLDIAGITTPYARLTITDIFDVDGAPILITPPSATLSVATPVPGAINGLDYHYFEKGSDFTALPDFSTLTPVFEGAVNYPDLTIRDQRDHYAFKYTGYLDAPADGIYTFTLYSSDGSKLLIDGTTVVDWDGQHSPGPLSGWIALQAGKHAVDLQYFFDNQSSAAGDLIDSLTVSWSGPGFADPVEIPVSAWYRVPSVGEPLVTLSAPTNGASISGAEVPFSAEVTPNGASVEKVRFYVGETYWGEDDTVPYELDAFVWEAADNPIHARVFYDGNQTLDSAQSIVSTANMPLAPWESYAMSEHTYPQGARVLDGGYSLIGDGLNFLGRQVAGDCTLIARVSDLIGSAAGPDGEDPSRSWKAGVIMRETTASTPGTPLGNNSNAKFAAVFATVNNDTRFQDGTMSNAGGPYWSSGLGGQRWLKLQRVGNTFTTFVSTDGSSWTQVNSVLLSGINSTLYVGMFTYAASSQNPNVHSASFDSVSLVGNVVGPPAVTVAPQATTAYSGQIASFTALPSGNPPFGYQWQYNGTDLVGETTAALNLVNVQPIHSGLYSVVMTNASGSASSTAELTVLTPLPVTTEVLSNNPLGYWRLNDDGPVASDSIGSNSGTGQGGVAFGAAGAGSPFNGFESGNLAAQFNGIDSAVALPPPGITTANFTITGWAKRSGSQNNWAGLLFSRPGGGTGIMIVNNRLRFSWDDTGDEYNWDSGLSLPDGQWAFFALTISPTQAILYRATDGTLSSATRTGSNSPRTLDASFYMGYDPNSGTRRFKGEIDEVAFYNRTLTSAELQDILDASLLAAPAVALTAPGDGAAFAAPADISIAADVVANGQTISTVRFYNGSALLGEDTTAPYSLDWNGVAAGNYTLLAEAVYGGSSMSSEPVNIRVKTAPAWNSNPVNKGEIAVGAAFSGSLAGEVANPDGDPLTFSKVSGPVWLSVAPNGSLSGTPAGSDAGSNRWTVAVTDRVNIPVETELTKIVITGIDVANYSFELPGTSKQTHWDAVPGWSSDSVAANSGVERAGATEGSWAGYLMGSDPAVWNLTDEFIAMGELYTLRIDAKNTGSGSSLRIRLYYDNAGNRISLATLDAALSGTMQEFVLPYNSDDVPAAVGKHIGIELDNVVGGWVGFDNVRLKRTGAPDSDGDQMPDWWEIAKGLDPFTRDATLHSDSDVYDNWSEYVTDSDPQDGNSWQTYSFELAPETGDPTVRFISSTARNYAVEYRDDLTSGSWQDLVPAFTGSGAEMTHSDAASATNRFYRLRVEIP